MIETRNYLSEGLKRLAEGEAGDQAEFGLEGTRMSGGSIVSRSRTAKFGEDDWLRFEKT